MNPLTQAVGWALLHLLWQATAVALVLGLVLSRMARCSANARYVAGCAALGFVLAALPGHRRPVLRLERRLCRASGGVVSGAAVPVVPILRFPSSPAWSSGTARALP
jgi:hypothetical protein